MKTLLECEEETTVIEPKLPDGPRPFALRFAEVSDSAHGNLVRSTAFGEQPTVYPTGAWSDMITITD